MQVEPSEPGTAVTVVGDTHGQLHDVLRMCAPSRLSCAVSLHEMS